MLPIERQPRPAEQQPRIAVVRRRRVDDDVHTGDHLRGVSSITVSTAS